MMYGMKAFSKPFDASDYREKPKRTTPRSVSFHDREEIRKSLALDSDGEFLMGTNRISRKSSLSSRLQNSQSLQICFLNEEVKECQEGDVPSESETNNKVVDHMTSNKLKNDLEHSSKFNEISPNNNSCNETINKLQCNKYNVNSQYRKLSSFHHSKLNQKLHALSIIPKPKEKSQFHEYHSRLHEEARSALSQAKLMAKMQIEVERQIVRYRSPLANLIDFPFHYSIRRNKISRNVCANMSIAQLQIIINDMYSHIESLNQELVQFLQERDELHMEQDSVLVDIEDLTIFLCSK